MPADIPDDNVSSLTHVVNGFRRHLTYHMPPPLSFLSLHCFAMTTDYCTRRRSLQWSKTELAKIYRPHDTRSGFWVQQSPRNGVVCRTRRGHLSCGSAANRMNGSASKWELTPGGLTHNCSHCYPSLIVGRTPVSSDFGSSSHASFQS